MRRRWTIEKKHRIETNWVEKVQMGSGYKHLTVFNPQKMELTVMGRWEDPLTLVFTENMKPKENWKPKEAEKDEISLENIEKKESLEKILEKNKIVEVVSSEQSIFIRTEPI